MSAPLDKLIRKVWVMDNAANPRPLTNRRVLPNSCANIAFIQGDGAIIQNRQGRSELIQGRYFCGQARYQVTLSIKPLTRVIMLQLHPWSPAVWTTDSLAHTADRILLLKDVLPSVDTWLNQHHLPASQTLHSEHSLITFIHDHFIQLPTVDPSAFPLRQACRRLQQTKGCLRIADLANELHCSTRQLEKQFKHHLGLTPKELTRILQIRGVVDTLQAENGPQSLTQVAIQYGFYDQAHFIRTFKKMIDHPPGVFKAADYLLPVDGNGY